MSRRRRTPEELRSEAISAGMWILKDQGPAAITLQAVARNIGVAHGNITHHFGTAANLQASVANEIFERMLHSVEIAVAYLRAGTWDETDVAKIVFDTLDVSGAGKLIGWLAASQNAQLDQIFSMLGAMVSRLERPDNAGYSNDREKLAAMVASVLIPALGASMMGKELSNEFGLADNFHYSLAGNSLRALRVDQTA